MSLRILHVLDHSLPHASGYVFRTLAILRGQRALGWDTLQLTTPRQGESTQPVEEIDGWRFHRTPAPRAAWLRRGAGRYLAEMWATARRIDELVRAWRPDLVHAHSPVLNALPALVISRRHRLPLVYEMRASWEDAAVDHGTTDSGSLRYRLSRGLESMALRQADAVTTICEGLRRDVLARGIADERVTVIPNAVDAGMFRADGEADPALRSALGLDDCDVLGFAGSFYGYEGLDLALEALALLASRRPRLRLLLLGGGPQESALRNQARALGIEERVIFAGRIPHQRVQQYTALVDVFLFPRRSMRLTELVTPLKPLEAMAQRKPVLASDVGGHRELIRNGETGWLFMPGNSAALAQSIERAFDDRSDWARITGGALAFVHSERTWSRSVGRYVQVYRSALARRGRGGVINVSEA